MALILTRKFAQGIVVEMGGKKLTIFISRVLPESHTVRLGFNDHGDQSIKIYREEVYLRDQQNNKGENENG